MDGIMENISKFYIIVIEKSRLSMIPWNIREFASLIKKEWPNQFLI